jgi:hypothetical protein
MTTASGKIHYRTVRLWRVRRLLRVAQRFALDFWRGIRSPVMPIEPISCPSIDLTDACDPIPEILAARAFPETVRWFAQSPAAARSLVSADAQALLHAMVRNIKPEHVFEIGTFRCGTTETIARALLANGTGTLHTADPFGSGFLPGILYKWPRELRRRVRFYPLNSMAFFNRMTDLGVVSGLTFIDGSHDYESALFDLHSATRQLAPGGFIFLDNVSQAGPFFAAADFMRDRYGWRECGSFPARYRVPHPFDRHRSTIHNTDFLVLRAPSYLVIGKRPETAGQKRFRHRAATGFRLTVKERASGGTLTAQCIVRGFGAKQVELEGQTSLELDDANAAMTVHFPNPISLDADDYQAITVELWLAWDGPEPLRLATAPEVF